jgi:hypothetical protein
VHATRLSLTGHGADFDDAAAVEATVAGIVSTGAAAVSGASSDDDGEHGSRASSPTAGLGFRLVIPPEWKSEEAEPRDLSFDSRLRAPDILHHLLVGQVESCLGLVSAQMFKAQPDRGPGTGGRFCRLDWFEKLDKFGLSFEMSCGNCRVLHQHQQHKHRRLG